MLAFASSLYAGKDLSIVIRDSAIWCLVGALVMKLCYKLLAMFIRDAALARVKALEAEAAVDGAPHAPHAPQAATTRGGNIPAGGKGLRR